MGLTTAIWKKFTNAFNKHLALINIFDTNKTRPKPSKIGTFFQIKANNHYYITVTTFHANNPPQISFYIFLDKVDLHTVFIADFVDGKPARMKPNISQSCVGSNKLNDLVD